VIAALLFIVAAASADPIAEEIARGNALLEALDFQEAADLFTSVAVDERATEAQKIEANLLAGTAHRILGNDNEARLCFRYVLLRRPETRLNPSKSPKVVQFFELVRQELLAEASSVAPSGVPTSAVQAAPPQPGGGTLPFVVAAGGATMLAIGVGAAALVESSLAESRTAEAQQQLLFAGRASVVAAVIGAVAFTSGAVMWGLQ
jgi:hypothetical protein